MTQSFQGYYAHELADELHAEVQQPPRHLVAQQRLARIEINGQFLYTAIDPLSRRKQTLALRSTQTVPVPVHAASLQASPDELKTAILLFYGLLDEQQRRLGHGGDNLLSDFLGGGRAYGGARTTTTSGTECNQRPNSSPGGGRTPTEKKRAT